MSSMASHRRRWVFVHCPKTGGSSVTYSELGGMFEEWADDTHASLWDVCPQHGGYLKFMAVRNPWDVCCSWVRWHERHGDHGKTIRTAALRIPTPRSLGLDHMGFVMRFERLADDFAALCDWLGVERVELPAMNESAPFDRREMFDGVSRQIVAERFAPEIVRFGYEF